MCGPLNPLNSWHASLSLYGFKTSFIHGPYGFSDCGLGRRNNVILGTGKACNTNWHKKKSTGQSSIMSTKDLDNNKD